MTKLYKVQRKAEDLRTGNMFVDWAANCTTGDYPRASRIVSIRVTDHVTEAIKVALQDDRTFGLLPGQIVIVEVMA